MLRFPALTVLLALSSLGLLSGSAQIVGVVGSTSAPPVTLGGFQLTPFAPDNRPIFDAPGSDIVSVFSPLGAVTFSEPLSHFKAGGGLTWSHGYTGDAYYAFDNFTITLPKATKAFYFYAQPDDFANYTINVGFGGDVTATAVNSVSAVVNGNGGATYFGFYATGSSSLDTLSITSNAPTGLFVGEFGISAPAIAPVPEPATYALAGVTFLGCAIVLRRRKRRNPKSS